MFPKFLVN